jgi:hypothetical protein
MAFTEMLSPAGATDGAIGIMIIIFILVFLLIFVPIYVYSALALSKIAKRLKYSKPWLAWIPIANMWLFPAMAKMHWWPVLVFLIATLAYLIFSLIIVFLSTTLPFLGLSIFFASFVYTAMSILYAVYFTIWLYKICMFRHKPGWLAIIPGAIVVASEISTILLGALIGAPLSLLATIWLLVLIGILAWSKE